MEIPQQQSEPTNLPSPPGILALEGGEPKNSPPGERAKSQWQRISQQATQFLDKFPDYVGGFLNENRQVIFTLLSLVLGIITLRGILALLKAVHSVPLISLFFELIGLGYTTWFTFRYLLQSQTREELVQKISDFKQRAFG
jgi:hypothetical protein